MHYAKNLSRRPIRAVGKEGWGGLYGAIADTLTLFYNQGGRFSPPHYCLLPRIFRPSYSPAHKFCIISCKVNPHARSKAQKENPHRFSPSYFLYLDSDTWPGLVWKSGSVVIHSVYIGTVRS